MIFFYLAIRVLRLSDAKNQKNNNENNNNKNDVLLGRNHSWAARRKLWAQFLYYDCKLRKVKAPTICRKYHKAEQAIYKIAFKLNKWLKFDVGGLDLRNDVDNLLKDERSPV